MANNFEYSSIFQSELDNQMAVESVTGWMDANSGKAIYNGGADIKIPKIEMDGLGDYDRDTGYPEGSVTLVYETKTMTQDRARSFNLDAQDVNETNFVANAGAVMGEFQRTKVVPEVDMYRLYMLAKLAGDHNRTYTVAAASVFGALMDDIAAVQDKIGSTMQLMVHISTAAHALLGKSTEFTRKIDLVDFKRGEISTKVRAIDGNVLLLPTQSALLHTAIIKHDGRKESEKKGGYIVDTANDKAINWLIAARNAPIAVCKTDKVRTFTPEEYQKADAWHIDYRKYHDLWVADNKVDGLFANIGA